MTLTSFRSEPFLWIHLAGLAAMPLFLGVALLVLSLNELQPISGVELVSIAIAGIVPVLWMQWNRPFDIFSLLVVSLKLEKLTRSQQQILSLLKTNKQRALSAIAAVFMSGVGWQLSEFASDATVKVPFLGQWRIAGLLVAALAFLASNLFLQVPTSIVGILLTSQQQFDETEPFPLEKISEEFTVPGIRVDWILPWQNITKG